MEVKATLRYLRIAPRKVRLVADLIRGKKVSKAKEILTFCKKKAATSLLKLLNSAISNAKNNFNLKEDNLFIEKIFVNEGSKFKRIFPRSRGRADILHKRTSHVTIVLTEIKNSKEKEQKT